MFLQLWTSVFSTSREYTDMLSRCISPFWRDMYTLHECDILEAQSIALASQNLAAGPSSPPSPGAGHSHLTYEQLQRQAVSTFRDLICTQTKEELIAFMVAVTSLRSDPPPPSMVMPSSTSTPRTVVGPGEERSPAGSAISNPTPQKHKSGRIPNFGEVRKTSPTKTTPKKK